MKHLFICILMLTASINNSVYAQNRLTPYASDYPIDDPYSHQIKETLWQNIKGYDFVYIIAPSFHAESCCYYDEQKGELVLRTANTNIYYEIMYAKIEKREPIIEVKEYRCPISKEVEKRLERLFNAAVLTSSFLEKEAFIHDGTTYRVVICGGKFAAECWSPNDQESNCFRLKNIMEDLVSKIKEADIDGIDIMLDEVDSLCQSFENLIPNDLKNSKKADHWMNEGWKY